MHERDSGGSSAAPSFQRGNQVARAPGDHYTILDFLGRGGFGECYAAQRAADYVAVKIVDKKRLKERQHNKIYREIKLHRHASHRHIVRLNESFENERYFFIVMELCKSKSLLTIINEAHASKGYFDEELGARYVSGIVDAVSYLNTTRILHRDIKPGNVLIGLNGDVKLGDFGLAIEFHDLVAGSISGTPNYLAPEVIGKKGHSLASEVWSIGCLIYCMLVGKPPFEANDVESTYARIQTAVFSYPSGARVSDQAKGLMARCLEPDPVDRIKVWKITDHPWIARSAARLTDESGYPLMRAKSTGNMLRDMNGNYAAGVPVPARYRPKSAMLTGGSSSAADRSRRKSITASHDSGFGSESDLFKLQNNAYNKLEEKIHSYSAQLRDVLAGRLELVACPLPPLFITKWVDYSNRRGFGCKFTDGTLTVKFNEGVCLSWPRNSRDVLYAQKPLVGEKIIDAYSATLTPLEQEHIEIAHSYSQYMDRELRGTDYSAEDESENVMDSPYIVHHHLDEAHLAVVLSNGTVQVNLNDIKTKVVLWRENESEAMGVALLTRNFPPCAFRIVRPEHAFFYQGRFCGDRSRMSTDCPSRFAPFLRSTASVLDRHCLSLKKNFLRPEAPRTVQVTSC